MPSSSVGDKTAACQRLLTGEMCCYDFSSPQGWQVATQFYYFGSKLGKRTDFLSISTTVQGWQVTLLLLFSVKLWLKNNFTRYNHNCTRLAGHHPILLFWVKIWQKTNFAKCHCNCTRSPLTTPSYNFGSKIGRGTTLLNIITIVQSYQAATQP